jgi:hypothetical protein
MNNHNNNRIAIATAAVALAAFCGTARADLVEKTATAYPGGGTSWALDPNGHSPFYSSGNLATSGNFTARGPAGPSTGATATVLAETVTIANGAGTLGLGSPLVANTNYVLTGISMLISGYDSTHALSLHIFDVTSTLTGGVTASGASYNFAANGDLLGAGNGLSWTNATLSGAEQQVYLGLQNGPTTYGDQVVFASNHTYTVEVWIPTTASGAFNWFKSSSTPQDIGGEAMAGTDASLSVARITGSAAGFYGSSQHGFAVALYGSPTSAAPSVNNNTNAVPVANYYIDRQQRHRRDQLRPFAIRHAEWQQSGLLWFSRNSGRHDQLGACEHSDQYQYRPQSHCHQRCFDQN